MIQARTLADLDGVQHRFFTRRGGVSAGLYSSLNCGYGSGDQPDNVRENRRRAAAAFDLGESELLTVHQIHSTDVLTVADQRWSSPGAPKADALVTDRPGVVLGVLAADCAPVLFADGDAGVIGAAHAGWKGALGGVVDATIAAMERLGARRERIRAAVGPCIGRNSYEVGPEFPRRSWRRTRPMPPSFGRPRAPATSCSTLRATCRIASVRAGIAVEAHRPRYAGGRRRFLQLSPQYPGRRARLRPGPVGDRAQRADVPYLIILMFCCLLGDDRDMRHAMKRHVVMLVGLLVLAACGHTASPSSTKFRRAGSASAAGQDRPGGQPAEKHANRHGPAGGSGAGHRAAVVRHRRGGPAQRRRSR